ncbi:MAG: methionyl-tRNA formyltransferase [Deltaproteobacteria bacterium]|nr:methionyl-tRNA formyltransferase [Deltaproteobacteria bacterium]
MSTALKISILLDNPDSWIVSFAQDIQRQVAEQHDVKLYFKPSEIPHGDMLFLLGCTSIISREILQRNKHNLVIHESDLPKGRGWSPVPWQILEGKNSISIVLFEATEELDAGQIYLRDYIELDGTELLSEIKQKQGKKTAELVYTFLEKWPNIRRKTQSGEATYHRKRTERDDELDVGKTIIENFNHLRIVDNEKYPAWFKYKRHKYIVKIYKANYSKD